LLPSDSERFTTASSAGESTLPITLGSHSPTLQWMRSHTGILSNQDLHILPQLQALPQSERDELTKIGTDLLVPLKTKEQELVGLLVLGQKLSQQPYSEEDKQLLLTVASRVAIEFENARLYASEKAMRAELQRQNEQKTEFLHSVAHELKTPLTAIISSIDLLDTEAMPTSPDQKQRLTQNISQSAWRMDKRLSGLLEFAKTQADGLELKLQPVAVGSAIDEVVSEFLILFTNKGQSLKVQVSDALPQVKAERARLHEVLTNLLSNANKYSPRGSSITLRAKEIDNRVVVQVEDSAPAITEEEKANLFTPYYRGEDADKRQRFPGLGLGLAISRQLVELHQGEIWVESEDGKGNTFSFSLPALK